MVFLSKYVGNFLSRSLSRTLSRSLSRCRSLSLALSRFLALYASHTSNSMGPPILPIIVFLFFPLCCICGSCSYFHGFALRTVQICDRQFGYTISVMTWLCVGVCTSVCFIVHVHACACVHASGPLPCCLSRTRICLLSLVF